MVYRVAHINMSRTFHSLTLSYHCRSFYRLAQGHRCVSLRHQYSSQASHRAYETTCHSNLADRSDSLHRGLRPKQSWMCVQDTWQQKLSFSCLDCRREVGQSYLGMFLPFVIEIQDIQMQNQVDEREHYNLYLDDTPELVLGPEYS